MNAERSLRPEVPALYVIPTPIGNMGDITLRALEVLRDVSLLLCEDTRRVRKLLAHYEINRVQEMIRFDAHTERKETPRMLARLQRGEPKTAALVCDAGTPGLCDAGYVLIAAAHRAGLSVSCLPGATALVPALVMTGLPMSSFYFEGFLPHKKGRGKRWDYLVQQERTWVIYESKHRLLRTLHEMEERFGGRPGELAVCCELSKWHESVLRGSIAEIITHFEHHAPRGEFVLVYHPQTGS